MRRVLSIAAFGVLIAASLAACGGGGGGSTGGGTIPNPGATATPVPGSSATPVPGSTATPNPGSTATPAPGGTATPNPGSTATPAAETITGKIVDAGTGLGIGGITVAAAPGIGSVLQAAMSGSSAPVGNTNVATATTASDGSFTINCGTALKVSGTDYCASANFSIYFAAYGGASYGMNSFHGTFGSGFNYGQGGSGSNVGTLKLTNPNAEEVTELAHLNAFRAAPGPGSEYGNSGATYPAYSSNALYGNANSLVFDENRIEVAHYWAAEMHQGGTYGHTCATINNPPGCVDPLTYGGTLPGVRPANFGDAQNVAAGFVSWTDNASFSGTATGSAETAFELEGGNTYGASECSTAYDAKTCTFSDPPGGAAHFSNIMSAS